MKKMILRALYGTAAAVLLAIGCGDNGVQTKSQKIGDFVNAFRDGGKNSGKYTVTVSSAGSGATVNGEYSPREPVTVTAGTPPAGYRFKEWISSVSGVTFVPGADFQTVIFVMPASAVTVTAKFERTAEAKKYTVTVFSDGTAAGGGGEYAPNDTVRVTSGTPPDGYQFQEWTSSVDKLEFIPSPNNTAAMFIMPDDEVTVTAKFDMVSAAAPAITFDANGGTVYPPSRVTGADGRLANLPVPTRKGYTFGGWFRPEDLDDPNAKHITAGDMGTVFTADAEIYARWTITTYTIKYELDSGTVAVANPTGYTVETPTFKLNNPTRTGYRFVGWTEAGETTKPMDTTETIIKGSIGNKSYTAHWIESATSSTTFIITFNPNGGSVSPASATTKTDSTLASLPAPTRDGYSFDGWFTAATGGTAVSTGTKFTANATIYARWTANPVVPATYYTITFNANGGSVYTTSATTNASGYLSSLPAPTRDGYSFDGWFTTATGGTAVSTSSKFTVNTTIYAHWTEAPASGWVDGGTLNYKGQYYRTVKIGGKRWMAENLNLDTANGTGSWCYGNDNANCAKYGRLYNWNTAMAVCPSGWHLSSRDDWDQLAESVGGTKASYIEILHDWLNAGKKLKSTSGWSGWSGAGNGTDDYGFSALPGGYYNGNGFYHVGEDGYWWTATDRGEYADDNAYGRGMSYGYDGVGENFYNDKGNGYSVRCVSD